MNGSGKAGDENGPKRCQMRRLGYYEVYFILFVYLVLIIILRYYLCFKGFGEVAAGEMGPNDTSGIVWVISKFF